MAHPVSPLSFNRGLDGIVRTDTPASPLPKIGRISPGSRLTPSPLVEAVVPVSLDEKIAAYFEPQITDASVLAPERFRQMANLSATALLTKARAAAPEAREKLMDAVDILNAFSADLTSLEERRGALIRG